MSPASQQSESRRAFTPVEQRIDAWTSRRLARLEGGGPARRGLIEFTVFVLKQAWACIFGAAMLAAIVAARLWYPDDALVARSDALVIAAVAIQALMLESGRELWVILLFHAVGTVMEVFKTDVGSWSYEGDGVLRIAAVPLYTGFMYAAVGSYMVRVWRRMPILVAFTGVAFFIWIAENIGTAAGAWIYPDQADGWQIVSISKLVSWLLLMIISVVLVMFVYRPQVTDPVEGAGRGTVPAFPDRASV